MKKKLIKKFQQKMVVVDDKERNISSLSDFDVDAVDDKSNENILELL
jgi:Fe-S-cluster formation regulator IscX/YfhJ